MQSWEQRVLGTISLSSLSPEVGRDFVVAAGQQNPSRPRECKAEAAGHTRRQRDCTARSVSSKARVSLTQERPLEVNTPQHLAPFHLFKNPPFCQVRPTFCFRKREQFRGGDPRSSLGNGVSLGQKDSGSRSSYCSLRTRAFPFHVPGFYSSVALGKSVRLCTANPRLSAPQASVWWGGGSGWNETDGLGFSVNYSCSL